MSFNKLNIIVCKMDYKQFLKYSEEVDTTPYYSKYFNEDIIENMLITSDMQEVEILCNTNKNINLFCQNKNIWKIIEKNNIVLFENINQIQTFSEFIQSYKKYKYYETLTIHAINTAKKYNNQLYITCTLANKRLQYNTKYDRKLKKSD